VRIDLTGRRALVTGGTRGIGAAIARALAAAGAEVTATASSEESRARAAAEPALAGIALVPVDLADRAATEAFAAERAQQPFDVLVNNAGINKIALAGDLDLADWDRIQAVNVRAPLVLSRALVGGMAEQGWGRIVNISSVFGDVSRSQRAAYTASKYALRGLTRTLALDYATRGVLVNAVAPGFIDTELTRAVLGADGMRAMAERVPLRRLGTPDEIARVVTFLASDANTYLTGQHLVVDGGFTSE
jgi:3-oxoacyl-[acyl-carrier protein] reductase